MQAKEKSISQEWEDCRDEIKRNIDKDLLSGKKLGKVTLHDLDDFITALHGKVSSLEGNIDAAKKEEQVGFIVNLISRFINGLSRARLQELDETKILEVLRQFRIRLTLSIKDIPTEILIEKISPLLTANDVSRLIRSSKLFGQIKRPPFRRLVTGDSHTLVQLDQKVYAFGLTSPVHQKAAVKGFFPSEGKVILQVAILGSTSIVLYDDHSIGFYGANFVEDAKYNRGMPRQEKPVRILTSEQCAFILCESKNIYALYLPNNFGKTQVNLHKLFGSPSNNVPIPEEEEFIRIARICGICPSMLLLSKSGTVYLINEITPPKKGTDSQLEKFVPPTHCVAKFEFESDQEPLEVVGMDDHYCILSKNGLVFRLKQKNRFLFEAPFNIASLEAELIKIDASPGKKAIQVAAGGYHTLILYEDGSVYGFGINLMGQLGRPRSEQHVVNPKLIELPEGERVVKIAAAESHSLFLCESGNLYGCGVLLGRVASYDHRRFYTLELIVRGSQFLENEIEQRQNCSMM